MNTADMSCLSPHAFQHLGCRDVRTVDGITLEDHIFLISQLPCCAQLALPFWAKITGRITNNREEETLLAVVATLLDNDGLPLAQYSDVMVLDAGEKGEFEVKLIEHHDRADAYRLTVEETE